MQLVAFASAAEPKVEVGTHDSELINQVAPAGQGHDVKDKTSVIDPACGMTVDTSNAEYRSVHDGETYYFCAAGCKASFDKDPGKFIGAGNNGKSSGR